MLDYEVSPKAEKYIKKIKDKDLKEKFKDAIKKIRHNPNIGKLKKGDLAGSRGFDVYYNGANYEICYMVKDNKLVIIILIGSRENFYDEIKPYAQKYL